MIINQIPFFGLFFSLFFLHFANSSIFEKAHKQQCQPIHIDSCLDLPYNSTIAPKSNIFGDEQSLSEQVRHFNPLFKTKCSPHLKFLVCSVFAPMCPPEMPQAVTSCRSVCEEVKRDCMSILTEFDIKWPSLLNCTNFPLEPELCMKPAEAPARVTTHPTRSPIFNSRPRQSHIHPIPHQLPSCPADLLNLDPTDANSKCALPCNRHFLFSQEKSELTEDWLLTGALVNVIVTAFTFLTFMIDRDRFRFPERSVFYIALCSLTSSLPYLSRYFLTYEQTGCDRMPTGRLFLVHEGLDNTVCVLSFLFNYYFGMAGCVWWLMSTFIWYLSTARKWVQEEIEKREVYLHLVAWGLPALPSITILILQKVDASELIGICSVGNLNPYTLMSFVLIPRLVLVFFGSCFIIAGFSSMCGERKSFKRRGTDTSKLDTLLFKMGSFSTLYIVPTLILCLCDAYHVFVLTRWYPTTVDCKRTGGTSHCPRAAQPHAEVYMLALAMSLASGLATGLWILSSKTLKSWRRVLCCGHLEDDPSLDKPLLIPTQTYIANSQPQHHPLITQVLPNANGVNHYIPLSVMTNGQSSNLGSSRQGYHINEHWKNLNGL